MAVELLGPGWNISQKGEQIITEDDKIKIKSVILKNALNNDLKEIGSPVLNKFQNKTNISQVVLQIQKLRNISAPKANENSQAAPRMLKLVLTDGDSYIQAIEVALINSLSIDRTPPGAKIFIQSAKIISGYVLLDSSNCSLLGGQVPALFEKWELAKSVQHHSRHNASSDGPPAWVNFGRKLQTETQDKSFKSLENKKNDEKESSKFELQRQDAIAEATSGAVKKVFGGGAKVPVQQPPPRYRKPDNKFQKNRNRGGGDKEDDEKPQKPMERVSLFEFLEDKLPNQPAVEHKKPVEDRQSHRSYNNGDDRQFHKGFNRNVPSVSKKDSFHAPKSLEMNGITNNFGQMSLNTEFASRSLKQHLNLNSQKKLPQTVETVWKCGDDCMAKYWEDGKFYNARITAVTEKTCVVQFKGYGNIEEVLKGDCTPTRYDEGSKKVQSRSVEFRKGSRTFHRH